MAGQIPKNGEPQSNAKYEPERKHNQIIPKKGCDMPSSPWCWIHRFRDLATIVSTIQTRN
jgi:hypothetical protein